MYNFQIQIVKKIIKMVQVGTFSRMFLSIFTTLCIISDSICKTLLKLLVLERRVSKMVLYLVLQHCVQFSDSMLCVKRSDSTLSLVKKVEMNRPKIPSTKS